MRGLKFIKEIIFLIKLLVAPYMGAWIEISTFYKAFVSNLKVAPYMGAWIEIKGR